MYLGTNFGEVAEWLKAAVLKTVDPKGSGGSNPSLSANKSMTGQSVMLLAAVVWWGSWLGCGML